MNLSSVLPRTLASFALAAGLLSAAACSGGDDSDTSSSIPEGDEDFVPPPSGDGSGQRPSGATDATCTQAEDCGYWYCECSDGAIVNTANCTNGFCLDAPTTCPTACEYFDHGGWSGRVGGGPTQPEPEPQPEPSCGEQGSTSDTCWSCVEDSCCAQSESCYANVDCLGYWDCLYACGFGDPNCEYSCAEQYPFGVDDFEDLAYCTDSQCSSACL